MHRAPGTRPHVTLVRATDAPWLRGAMDAMVAANLPEFMTWASPGNWRWHSIYELHPDYQVGALSEGGDLLGAVHAVPVAWDGGSPLPGGYDDVLVEAVDHPDPEGTCATCLLSISVQAGARGTGLPALLLGEMRRLAGERRHVAVIAPLRPTRKVEHPLVPMAEYAAWTGADGEPYDPWVRTHLRLGGEIIGVAERSLVIAQPRARWETVTGHPMPPGTHLVPGALAPVHVDESGIGRYTEPNIWIRHRAGAPPPPDPDTT